MLNILRNDLLNAARRLPKAYESYKIDELATGYVKATEDQNEGDRDMYYSAVVLRFWYLIDRIYQKDRTLLADHSEAFEVLVDGINLAFSYKGWLIPEKHINAQQCIQQAILTVRRRRYYEANLDKHKVNFSANRMSLDAKMNDDNEDSWIDALSDQDDQYAKIDADLETNILIQSCIDDKKIVQAIIMDTIAYNDCEKVIKKTHRYVDSETGKEHRRSVVSHEFWPYRLVQLLGALPEDYADYFSNKYDIKAEELDAALERVRRSSNPKLYKFVDHTLDDLRDMIEARV